ncbi:LLM class flavin-dependent oxidoreductase [Rhodococcus ruber]|uniref:LLM class flavin-dependent oxidoreductase n=1 Tax=Rhodococcus ruber TaxID=1830 RepID=A0ABT4MDV2_9NOCA|nr:LLM class flavin-dependent oxidoreductase [Rhodococcus ruber]MCZ4519147.1 LLM class flavin-dependent oxidoreductase [Rhodococcus ruber]
MAHYTEFGVGFGGTLPPGDYHELARALEDYGFHVATAFGDLMMQPPAMVLAAMATATSRLRLGIGCFTPWTLHPVEIAGQMAYLDQLSGGRAFLGIVRGAWLDQLGIDTTRALTAIEDTLGVVEAVLAGDGRGYDGTKYSVAAGTRPYYPVLRRVLPLMIGTWSPKLAELAGRRADEIQVGGCANAAMVPLIRGWAEVGETAVGKDPGSTRIVLTAVTVVDEDGDAARRRARTDAALPMHAIATLDRTVSLDPDLLARMGTLLREHRYEDAGLLIPDDLLTHFSFCGTPTEVAEQAAAAYDAGATRVEFDSPFGVTESGGIDLLGNRVLPVLRSLGYGS